MFIQKPCDQLEVYFTLQSAHEEEVQLLILLCQHSPLPCCSRSHLCRQRSQQYWKKQSCRFSGQLPVGRTGESTESWPSSFSVTPCSEKCQGRGKVLEMGVLWFFKRSTCRVLLTTGSSLQPINIEKQIITGQNICPCSGTASDDLYSINNLYWLKIQWPALWRAAISDLRGDSTLNRVTISHKSV